MIVPLQLIAGDTWSWEYDHPDYLASEWTSVWYFENATASFSVTGVADDDSHTATVIAATTAGKVAGDYHWQARFTRISDSFIVSPAEASGWTTIRANPGAVGNYDHRSQRRIELDAINAYLRDPTNLQAASYTLGDRALSRWDLTKLYALRKQLESDVKQETAEERGVPRWKQRRLYATSTRYGQ